jgi:hypothetical protein
MSGHTFSQSNPPRRTGLAAARRTARRPWRGRLGRRGVVAILAMMFLVLFGSLSVAMAVASKGNLRTAETHIHVLRATSAAETGLDIAIARLDGAARRFVVARSTMDGPFVRRLWSGTTSTSVDGRVVIGPPEGYAETSLPPNIINALRNHYLADGNTLVFGSSVSTPTIGNAPTGASTTVFATTGWLTTPITAIDGTATDANARPAAYNVVYAPLANGTDIAVVVTGYSAVNAGGTTMASNSGANDTPVTRTVSRVVRLTKQHRHAIVSPSRILIGKNVEINGSIGAAYEDVGRPKGNPLQIRSDFLGLNARLDQKLNDFFNGVRQHDVDGDQRLRATHPVESAGLPPASRDYDSNGVPDNAFQDVTGDGFVDDFDIFIKHYDTNGDGKLVLATSLTAGTTHDAQTAEFTADNDLARLIDGNNPDRNRNRISGWQDTNRNGRWDAGENLNDFDATSNSFPDRVLGWRDGAIDRRDQYAKVQGRLMFRTSRSAWETARGGNYQQFLDGSINAGRGVSAARFETSQNELPEISLTDIAGATTSLAALADGQSLEQQAATQLGISASAMATYTEAKTNATQPRFFRATMDNAQVRTLTGQNLWERMPFNSPNFTDWYIRPRYENMTFKNVKIPPGTNALFVNCTFVGVTHVQTTTANTHTNWSLYGRMIWDAATNRPVPDPKPLDKSDFARYTTGRPVDGPVNYNDFPDPPVIGGVTRTGAARDTKLYSNNIRFHNSLIVGSIVSDTPQVFNPVRNKLQFTGSTRFTRQHPDSPSNVNLNPDSADLPAIDRSSLMLPQYSVEIGQFNSPTDTFTGGPTPQNVQLRGTIVAGVLDARGNTTIEGSLLMTFKPVLGQAPLEYNGTAVGNPANFNLSLGYFGPDDGDEESLDPDDLPTVGGVKIVGYDTDGDGLADVKHDQPQPPGSTPVPFYGFGRLQITLNPDLPMPDGILLPVSVISVANTYQEGRPW